MNRAKPTWRLQELAGRLLRALLAGLARRSQRVAPVAQGQRASRGCPVARRCDVPNCGRNAEVTCDGRSLCSWHWAEHQFT